MGFFRRMTSQRVTATTETEDLTFECMSDYGTIYLVGYNNVSLVDLEYKVNDGEYEPYEYTDVELTQGDKVSFRGVNTIDCFSMSQSDYIQFEMEGQWNASGDESSIVLLSLTFLSRLPAAPLFFSVPAMYNRTLSRSDSKDLVTSIL